MSNVTHIRARTALHWLGSGVGLVGFCLFIYAAGWLAGVGLFLVLFGNNMHIEARQL